MRAVLVVRVAAHEAYRICFALDAGVRVIMVPMVTPPRLGGSRRAPPRLSLWNRSNAGVLGEWEEFKNYRDYMDP